MTWWEGLDWFNEIKSLSDRWKIFRDAGLCGSSAPCGIIFSLILKCSQETQDIWIVEESIDWQPREILLNVLVYEESLFRLEKTPHSRSSLGVWFKKHTFDSCLPRSKERLAKLWKDISDHFDLVEPIEVFNVILASKWERNEFKLPGGHESDYYFAPARRMTIVHKLGSETSRVLMAVLLRWIWARCNWIKFKKRRLPRRLLEIRITTIRWHMDGACNLLFMVHNWNVGCINQIVLRSLTWPIKAISEDPKQIFIGERWYLQIVFTLDFRDL